MNEYLDAFKHSVSKSYNEIKKAVKEPEVVKKTESSLSNFFSNALSKLKSTFGSPKTSNSELNKQEAINAFNEFADKHPKKL